MMTWARTLLALVAVLLAGCSKKDKDVDKEAEPVTPVQVSEVRRQPIERLITAEGTLRAINQSAVVSKISAPVQKFYVNRGDHVRQGQLLAVLENRDLSAAVIDNRGGYEQAQATYNNTASATVPEEMVKARQDVDAAKEALDAAQKVYDSRVQLYKEGALARKLVDDAAVALAQARSTYETAQKHLDAMQAVGAAATVKGAAGQLESAKGKLEGAQAQLAYSEVRSPISGKIADRPLFVGEMASAGTPLLTVVDISSVIARVNVPAAQAAYLRVGQPATVAATDSDVQSNGRVTVVSPAVDPGTTTVEIWVQAPNPGERLLPGGAVHVTIDAGTIPNAVTAPATALLPGESGGSVVMVVGNDNVAHQHDVTVGVRNGDVVQLVSGASPGDRVVTGGGIGLTDGAKVRIQAAAPAEGGGKDAGDKE
jgi:multidrug efflux pump subunit AcrA (membrane-fusion protein)